MLLSRLPRLRGQCLDHLRMSAGNIRGNSLRQRNRVTPVQRGIVSPACSHPALYFGVACVGARLAGTVTQLLRRHRHMSSSR